MNSTNNVVVNNRVKAKKEPFDSMSLHTLEALVISSRKAAARYSSIAAKANKALKKKRKELRA